MCRTGGHSDKSHPRPSWGGAPTCPWRCASGAGARGGQARGCLGHWALGPRARLGQEWAPAKGWDGGTEVGRRERQDPPGPTTTKLGTGLGTGQPPRAALLIFLSLQSTGCDPWPRVLSSTTGHSLPRCPEAEKPERPEPPVTLIHRVWDSLQNNCLIDLLSTCHRFPCRSEMIYCG